MLQKHVYIGGHKNIHKIGGHIRIYRREDTQPFVLLAEAEDPEPLQSEYISFGSWNKNLVKFYFNCSFNFGTPDEVLDTTDHPLLVRDVPASIDLRNCMWIDFNSERKLNQFINPFSFRLLLFVISPCHQMRIPFKFRLWVHTIYKTKWHEKCLTTRLHSPHRFVY